MYIIIQPLLMSILSIYFHVYFCLVYSTPKNLFQYIMSFQSRVSYKNNNTVERTPVLLIKVRFSSIERTRRELAYV